MSKKTAGFDLINSNFRYMSTCISLFINFHLLSFDLHAAECSSLRVKTQSYFEDQSVYRYEVPEISGDLTIFLKSSTAIFITVSAWCQI